jgi:hypothetical protein
MHAIHSNSLITRHSSNFEAGETLRLKSLKAVYSTPTPSGLEPLQEANDAIQGMRYSETVDAI